MPGLQPWRRNLYRWSSLSAKHGMAAFRTGDVSFDLPYSGMQTQDDDTRLVLLLSVCRDDPCTAPGKPILASRRKIHDIS